MHSMKTKHDNHRQFNMFEQKERGRGKPSSSEADSWDKKGMGFPPDLTGDE